MGDQIHVTVKLCVPLANTTLTVKVPNESPNTLHKFPLQANHTFIKSLSGAKSPFFSRTLQNIKLCYVLGMQVFPLMMHRLAAKAM